jgi:uncharacterized membrane protein YeaQ/YmgE (transglycosylase-associated protein family)
MPIIEILPLLLVAVVVANLGQVINGYSVGRYIFVLIVGFIGAFFGIGIARLFELPELIPFIIRGEMFPVMWSIIGSLTLLWMFSMLTRRHSHKREPNYKARVALD